MTLSISLDVAQSGLSVAAEQAAVVSRNIANQGVDGASRKTANVTTVLDGGVRVVSITRASNSALQANMLAANADASAQNAIGTALDKLNETTGDPQNDTSPASYVQKLTNALMQFAAAPSNNAAGIGAVTAAGDLANALNQASATTQLVRQQADTAIATAVGTLNDLLAQFQTLNDKIVSGTHSGTDVTDLLDQRDAVLKKISAEVGIKTVGRAENDMAVYTDSGVTLFDVVPRSVTFQPTAAFGANTTGNAVFADGVVIAGGSGTMTVASGELAGLAQVRDKLAPTYQSQLDEVARGLIATFVEKDQSVPPTRPDVPGLFTYPGAPAIPPDGTVSPGLAATIRVNPAVDPDQGGNPNLLRDGGIGGPAYVYNTTGAAGFSDRLNQLVDALNASRAFDASAQAGATANIATFASNSIAWVQGVRKTADAQATYKATLLQQSTTALTNATGVNLDAEMTNLLDIERSYQASSKIIATINNMVQTLLNVVQ